MLATASCSKSFVEAGIDFSGGSDMIDIRLEAVSENPARLGLAQDGTTYDMVWAKGDEIAVIGTKTAKFALVDSTAKKPSGRFTGKLADAGEGPYYAVFPYSENAAVADGAIKFAIPQTVGAQQGNVASKTIPCVAQVGTDGGLQYAGMHNVTGLLKITLKSASQVVIKKMTLHDLGGNMLWGNCTVPILSDGTPDYEHITLTNGSNSISMLWSGSATISPTAKSYIFPIPPGALDRGFSLVIYKRDADCEDEIGDAYTFIQKISNPVAAQRSFIISMDEAVITDKSESHDVTRRGYYKSLFVDAGMFLTNRYKASGTSSSIPAISYIGLADDYEYFASHSSDDLTGTTRADDSVYQRSVFVSSPQSKGASWNDANGVLVYPDGAPRFRMIYSNGGRSYDHGRSLTAEGRDRIHWFNANGGSYSGSCAGSFLSATWVDGTKRYGHSNPANDWSYGLFPGELKHTHLPPSISKYKTVYTGMKVMPALKALGYYSFAGIDTVEDTRHHGGSYFPHNARNKSIPHEELFSYLYSDHHSADERYCYMEKNSSYPEFRYPDNSSGKFLQLVDSVNAWAYKKDASTGRVVCTGSHPEGQASGNQRDFTAMMFRYAMDGNGAPRVKQPDLEMGKTRPMDKKTSDDSPAYTGIGDRQYHHFKFTAAQPVENFCLTLASGYDASSGIDLYLSLRKGGLAWLSDADYVICTKGGNKDLVIKELPAGEWYVGVFCATTVTTAVTTSLPYYFKYSGKTEVLDGVPYSISIGVAASGVDKPDIYNGQDIGTDSLDD